MKLCQEISWLCFERTELYGLPDSVGSLKNADKMLFGIDYKKYINENSLPLVAEGGVKVLSEKTKHDYNLQNNVVVGKIDLVYAQQKEWINNNIVSYTLNLLFIGLIANAADYLFYQFLAGHVCGLYLIEANAVVDGHSYQSCG